MAPTMIRSLYRRLINLHPPAFRQRFAEEMLWIFDEATATRGAPRLLADGFVSLLRQWLVRPESWHMPLATAISPSSKGSSSFLAWEQFEMAQHSLPFYRWMQGSVISLGLLSAVWLMAGRGGRAPILLNNSTAQRTSRAAYWRTKRPRQYPFYSGFSRRGGGDTEDAGWRAILRMACGIQQRRPCANGGISPSLQRLERAGNKRYDGLPPGYRRVRSPEDRRIHGHADQRAGSRAGVGSIRAFRDERGSGSAA